LASAWSLIGVRAHRLSGRWVTRLIGAGVAPPLVVGAPVAGARVIGTLAVAALMIDAPGVATVGTGMLVIGARGMASRVLGASAAPAAA
jgi:hypothetical protein